MTIGVYAGSFDPFTKGHFNVVHVASQSFDKVVVAIGVNPKKKGLFSVDERREYVRVSIETWKKKEAAPYRVEIVSFEGLLVDYCESVADQTREKVVMVRGLRAVSDFETEMAIADANRRLSSGTVPTVFIPTKAEQAFVSSSIVKEIASHPKGKGKDPLLDYVVTPVAYALRARL
jgi:pantetheine-phosphate adenylyltransferase